MALLMTAVTLLIAALYLHLRGMRMAVWCAILAAYGVALGHGLRGGLSATETNLFAFIGAFIIGAAAFAVQARRLENRRKARLQALCGRR